MAVIEVFFDTTCPFCYKAHLQYRELLPEFPEIQLKWVPVEAHPRLEEPWYNPHVDLAVQGALFVRAVGGDEGAYHDRVFHAHFRERRAVDDIQVLADCAREIGLDPKAFGKALEEGTYAAQQLEANQYAYGTHLVQAVPTLICGNKRLDAAPGIGVTPEQIREFFAACSR